MGRIVVMNHVTLDGVMQGRVAPTRTPEVGSGMRDGADAPKRHRTTPCRRPWASG